MADTKKYIVAPGVSFVGNKRTYKAGDEIDETAFKDKERFEALKSGKNPRIILAANEVADKNDDEGNDDNGNDSGVSREELEKLALETDLEPEKIKELTDKQLVKILKKQGKLN